MPYRYNAITGELDVVLDASSSGGITQINADSGSASPVLGVVDIVGTSAQGVSTSAAGNVVTITVADASTTQKGVIELATGAEVTTGTSSVLAVVPSTLNTKLGPQTLNGVIYGQGGAGTNLAALGAALSGQLIIGDTGNAPVLANLTAGTGITITDGPGSITIAAIGESTGSTSTIGAVTADIIAINLGVTPSTYTIEARVAAFESTGPSGAGYKIFGVVRTDGATSTLIGTTVRDIVEDAALTNADADIIVSGNSAVVRVTGVAGLTIQWDANSDYTQGS